MVTQVLPALNKLTTNFLKHEGDMMAN